jgi:hypothetical protein
MVNKTMLKLEAGQFDIKTACLYGKLEEDLWMAIPEGYERYVKEKHKKDINTKTHCLKLTKAIYGLVQAAMQWWKKFKEVLETLNYIPSKADPCLFIKNENEKRSYLIICVDDGGICCETRKEIKKMIDKLSKHFVVKDLGNLETFVGCKIINNKTNDTDYILQPKLVKHLKQGFGGLVESLKEYTLLHLQELWKKFQINRTH